jgi:hypothetical protein
MMGRRERGQGQFFYSFDRRQSPAWRRRCGSSGCREHPLAPEIPALVPLLPIWY